MSPIDPNQLISIELPAKDWNTTLAALSELPHRIATPLINSIMQQVQDMTEPKGDGAEARMQQPMAAD